MTKVQLQNKDIKNVNKSGDNINLNLIITEMKKVKKRVKKVKQEQPPPPTQPPLPPPAPVLPDLVQYNYRQIRNIGTRPYDLPSTEINPANIPVPEYLQNVNYAQQLRQQQIQSLASQIQQLQPPAEEVPQPPQPEEIPPPQPEEIPPPQPEEMPRATYEGSERYQPASVQAEEPTPSPEAEDLTRMMQGLSMQPQPQEADIQSQITEYYGRYQEIADRVESGESIRKFNRQIGKLLNDIMSFYSYLEIPVPPKRGKQTGFSYISTLLESLGSSP